MGDATFDDLLPGMRMRYLNDAEFHAFVEVIAQERHRENLDRIKALERERDAHYDMKMDAIRRLNDLRVERDELRAALEVIAFATQGQSEFDAICDTACNALAALDAKKEGGDVPSDL